MINKGVSEFIMLNFTPVRTGEMSYAELAAALMPADLRHLTNTMIDAILALIADAEDADVIFVPSDPEAKDDYAENTDEVNLAWTLGHVIVHVIASAEESAFLAAEAARGVPYHGRSRWERAWQAIESVEQCRQCLEESRHMQLATLDVWPDPPHLDNIYTTLRGTQINPVTRFVFGLSHADSHLGQIREIMRQARAARPV